MTEYPQKLVSIPSALKTAGRRADNQAAIADGEARLPASDD
jgi:hypothetical protein